MFLQNFTTIKGKKLFIEPVNVHTMFTNAKNSVIKHMDPIPFFHTRDNLTTYLTDVCHLTDSLHSNASVLEELCEFDKRSSIESLAKHHIFYNICGNKKYPIKTIYQNMVKHGNIEDNITFNANMNSYHGASMTFQELKLLSKFATTHNAKVYFYQNGEQRDDFAKIHTRQPDPDGYFILYFSETKLTMIKKGIDIKLGTLKDSASQVYPVFIKNNTIKEVFNNINIDIYLEKKITAFKNFIINNELNNIEEEFAVLQEKLETNSIIEKFKTINDFNTFILINAPHKSYNSEFIQLYSFDQPEKPITSSSTDFFIDKLYLPNAETRESHQLRLANFIKELGSSQIEELLISSRNRSKRHPEFLKIFENKFDDPTKYF